MYSLKYVHSDGEQFALNRSLPKEQKERFALIALYKKIERSNLLLKKNERVISSFWKEKKN